MSKDAILFSVKGSREVVMETIFDAPLADVFAAFHDPKLIPEWWGPHKVTARVDHMDFREGGTWRFVHPALDGSAGEEAFHGRYLEINAPHRVVSTFVWEGDPGSVVEETWMFEAAGERTRVTVRSRFQSEAHRRAMVDAGMEWGARESWERMAAMVTRRKSP